MATQAYRDWRAAGSTFRLATPIAGLRSLARAHGVRWLGDIGNLDHLQAATPEDHTPFSVTAWPIPLVGYVITACDMDDGPWADRLLADARTGRAPWIKYLNFRGGNYSIKRYWERRANPDRHLHVSIRSDYLNYVLGAYNPFIAPPTPPEPPAQQTGALTMFMIQGDGDPTVWVSDGQTRRPLDWDTFVDYRDRLKLPLLRCPVKALDARGGPVRPDGG